jgi:hypothetical protein
VGKFGEQQGSRSNQKHIESVALGSGSTASEPFAAVQGRIEKVSLRLRAVGRVKEDLPHRRPYDCRWPNHKLPVRRRARQRRRDSRAIFVLAVPETKLPLLGSVY